MARSRLRPPPTVCAAAAASASAPPAYPSWWPRRLKLPSDGTFALLCAFWGALALRCAVALWGHSGQNAPPMFGDFEAQRHWMEVTVNLPPTAWYVEGRDNDLQYWGLDYPPLSAHLSWLIGKVALHGGRPELVALHASRGLETAEAKTFMRRSVQLCDALVFLPAALAHGVAAVRGRHRWLPLLQLVLLPALVLVDHGHFQYNCVSLGLALWAFTAALRGRPLACAFCFTLALNFKQMSLYLAPADLLLLIGRLPPRRHENRRSAARRAPRHRRARDDGAVLGALPRQLGRRARASSSASSRSAATCTRTRWRACGARSRSRRSSSSSCSRSRPSSG